MSLCVAGSAANGQHRPVHATSVGAKRALFSPISGTVCPGSASIPRFSTSNLASAPPPPSFFDVQLGCRPPSALVLRRPTSVHLPQVARFSSSNFDAGAPGLRFRAPTSIRPAAASRGGFAQPQGQTHKGVLLDSQRRIACVVVAAWGYRTSNARLHPVYSHRANQRSTIEGPSAPASL